MTTETQRVTAVDLANGRIRIPIGQKEPFPSERARVQVRIRGRDLGTVAWDPRMGPDRERSGVLQVGATLREWRGERHRQRDDRPLVSSVMQPVTFYVPASASEPVEVKVTHSGLRMVLVNRDSVRLLGAEWRVHGIYFLLGPADGDADRFRAYVGEVGRRDFLTRLNEHVAQKPWWSRALLVASDSPDGFNSAEIGWLEGRFYDVLNNAVAAELMNKGRPGDDTIAPKDRGVSERYVEPVMAALRACGAPPDTADQRACAEGQEADVLPRECQGPDRSRPPEARDQASALRKQLTKTALVLDNGSLEIDGQLFTAVSSAAVAVSGNKSEPGWEFWGAPSGDGAFVPLHRLRDRLRAEATPHVPMPATSVAEIRSPIVGSVSNPGRPGLGKHGAEDPTAPLHGVAARPDHGRPRHARGGDPHGTAR